MRGEQKGAKHRVNKRAIGVVSGVQESNGTDVVVHGARL